MDEQRTYKVGVFTHERPGHKPKITAYTLWYSSAWRGCCEHVILCANGTEAKTRAIQEHRTRCLGEVSRG